MATLTEDMIGGRAGVIKSVLTHKKSPDRFQNTYQGSFYFEDSERRA
jgi:hypothetical protein